jgi:hypothetical protein
MRKAILFNEGSPGHIEGQAVKSAYPSGIFRGQLDSMLDAVFRENSGHRFGLRVIR